MNHIVNMPKKLNRIKEESEDFEWYPSTLPMLEKVFLDVRDLISESRSRYDNDSWKKLLDIGAGDGNVFTVWDKLIDTYFPRDQHGYRPNSMTIPQQYFAIEKSKVLMQYLPKTTVMVGTDFLHQTLIDKKMDVIFCNPPYSEFEAWAQKAILEANTQLLYLIIPERWVNSEAIQSALKSRRVTAEVIHTDDFLNAPRAARAKINILRISYIQKGRYNEGPKEAFTAWFEQTFKPMKHHGKESIDENGIPEKELKKRSEVIPGKNLIERLDSLYRADLARVQKLYSQLMEMDFSILSELGVEMGGVCTALQVKLKGMKSLYWKELFSNMDKITDRLTSKSRKQMLEILNSNLSVDFSIDNAYAVVLWAIKNANDYYDKQLIDCYQDLVNLETAVFYKSNEHFVKDNWRFAQEESKYYLNDKLDYRIVTHRVGGIANFENWRSDNKNGIAVRAYEYIQDLCTVAGNLGYKADTSLLEEEWESGKQKSFMFEKNGKSEILFSVRAFKNGNLHFKFNQEFLRKFNVEYGRLMGWINNKSQASEEMNIPLEEMDKYFKANHHIMITAQSENLLEYAV